MYKVIWRQPDGKEGTSFWVDCDADSLGDAIMEYADSLFGLDCYTDGSDVWAGDRILMKDMTIIEG